MSSASAESRDLTPEQHAFIRRQLGLIPVYLWAVYAWWKFFALLPAFAPPAQAHVVRDFAHFYVQGVITLDQDAHALYDIDAMASVVARVVPAHLDALFPPVYGPQVGLIFTPFALLPYVPAMYAWLALTVIGYGVCAYLVWRSASSLRASRSATVAFALGAPGLHFALSYGQASVIGLICFTGLWLALRTGRFFAAGVAVGALAYKPQLGVAAAFVFLFAREWRIVFGAVFAVAVQLAAGWAYWGAAIYPAYFRALARLPDVINTMEPDKQMMHSWRAFFLYLGFSPGASVALMAVSALATLVLALLCWRSRRDLAPRYVVLVLATLLVDPHNQAYDLLLLVPALIAIWDWANGQGDRRVGELLSQPIRGDRAGPTVGAATIGLALFVYIAPLLTIVTPVVPVQWSVVSFLLLAGLLARHILMPSQGQTKGPAIQEVRV
jgi:alpha-1,2-mannosyltransferase